MNFRSLQKRLLLIKLSDLIERGHMVDIFTRYRKSDDPVDPQVKQYQLIDRTQYLDIPQAGRNVCWLPQRSS
jgi:hypothetical protein